MLTSKYIKDNLAAFISSCQKRHIDINFDMFSTLEEKRISLTKSSEEKKSKLNQLSKKVAALKQQGNDPIDLMRSLQKLSSETKYETETLSETQKEIDNFISQIPNLLHSDVPEGSSEDNNVVVRTIGEIPKFSFSPKSHFDLAGKDSLDFERASKISGSRFVFLRGVMAKIERALINFLLIENSKNGYEEVSPPTIVNEGSVFGTGQLPKFSDDIFHLGSGYEHFYLIPTAEVPLTNLYRDETLTPADLPKHFTAITSCFRAEAGAAGRDTRGLMRLHEFKKVELVKICEPANSEAEHEAMVANAEMLLKALELPYRVSLLCAGDTGFSAKKCYDIEVWVPSENKYREISSISNCGDFQARRTNIRVKNPAHNNGKPYHIHTLNGSALPLGRTIIALLENHQQEDGSVHVPKALQSHFGDASISFNN